MKKINKKTLALLIAAALLLTITVSGTVAYLVDSTGAVKNVFEPGKVVPDIIEPGWTDGNNTKSDVTIKNTQNVDAYIRAMIVVTWQDSNGNVYPIPPKAGDYSLEIGNGWQAVGDFYYYNNKVLAGESTGNLITSCSPKVKGPATGYTLHVEILTQAVQADGIGVNSATAAFEAVEKAPTTK